MMMRIIRLATTPVCHIRFRIRGENLINIYLHPTVPVNFCRQFLFTQKHSVSFPAHCSTCVSEQIGTSPVEDRMPPSSAFEESPLRTRRFKFIKKTFISYDSNTLT